MTTFGATAFGDDVPGLIVVNFVLILATLLTLAGLTTFNVRVFRLALDYWRRTCELQEIIVRQQEVVVKQQAETWTLLGLTKDWANSAWTNRVEAAHAAEEAKHVLAEHPTRADIAQAIEEVPAKTADMVTEKIKQGDSGEKPAASRGTRTQGE